MRRIVIPEPVLRELVARQPFYAIAQAYRCDTRTISALASRYGLASAFTAKAATAAEVARVDALTAEGWSIKKIAKTLGRSQDFVARRVHGLAAAVATEPRRGRRPRTGWPVINTTAAEVLGQRRFEDVDERVLAKECPTHRLPINGAALAAAARFANSSFSRSSADLCADE